MVEGVASVLVKLFVPGVVFFRELSKKFTRAFVGVGLEDFLRGIFEEDAIEFMLMKIFAMICGPKASCFCVLCTYRWNF